MLGVVNKAELCNITGVFREFVNKVFMEIFL